MFFNTVGSLIRCNIVGKNMRALNLNLRRGV